MKSFLSDPDVNIIRIMEEHQILNQFIASHFGVIHLVLSKSTTSDQILKQFHLETLVKPKLPFKAPFSLDYKICGN